MGLLSSRRIARAVDTAYDALDDEEQEPFAVMNDLDEEERLPALLGLTERLVDEEAFDHARLAAERALQLAPDSWEALGLLVQAERHDPERRPQAIAALKRLLAVDPGNPEVAADLAMILIENGQAEEALAMLRGLDDKQNPVLILRTGEALVSLGRQEEALAALAEVRELYNYRLKHGMLQGDAYEMREHMMGAARLYQEVQADLRRGEDGAGEDGAGEDGAGAPAHQPKDGDDDEVDLAHLGQVLMAESPRIARDLELRSPQDTVAAAERLLESNAQDPGALALLGSGLLRLGELEQAHARFEAACLADRKCFAGHLGLAAVADCVGHDLFEAADRLPPPPAAVELAGVVPDWPALTDHERRVVWAAIHPLRVVLPALGRAGARIRVLPLDVRPADLEPAASATLADARVERLLDVVTASGWSFAQEFARLAHPHLPAAVREQVAALRVRVAAAGWIDEEHPPADDAEFLAGAYADFLRQRHGLAEYQEPDELELHHDLMALFAGLVDRETLEG